MIGTGMTLILLLSYAVYSNTVDSEYYGYTTTNEQVELDLRVEEAGSSEWYHSTDSALTWINVSVIGAPPGSLLVVEADGTNWSHSPSLGLNDSTYVCNEPDSDYSSIIETCEFRRTHSIILESGEGTLRGRVSLELPIRGKGYLESENMDNALDEALDLISSEEKTITWKIKIEEDGQIAPSEGIEVSAIVTKHEFVKIEHFELEPVQETIYSISALLGCFFLVLVIPLMIYFSANFRERKNESIRASIEDE
jgi:hypothetical protein